MSKNYFYFFYFWRLHLKQNLFFNLFKSKNWKEKKIYIYILKQILISNLIFCDCYFMYKEDFWKFSTKTLIFMVSMIFWKVKLNRKYGRNCRIFFGIELLKTHLIDSYVYVSKFKKKFLIHPTLVGRLLPGGLWSATVLKAVGLVPCPLSPKKPYRIS